MSRPPCLGLYAADHPECDGEPNSPIQREQASCVWRDRCSGLRVFCDQMNHKPDKVIGTLGDGLLPLCDAQVKKFGIKDGQLTIDPRDPTKKLKPEKPSSLTPPKKSTDEKKLEKALEEARKASERARNHPKRRRRKAHTSPPAETPKEGTKPCQPTPEGHENSSKPPKNDVGAIKAAMEAAEGKPVEAEVPLESPRRPQNCPSPRPRPRPRKKARRRQKAPLPAEVVEIALHFEECLRETFSNHAFANRGRVVANPGTIYAVDRLKGCSYIRWYCASEYGCDFALARVRLKVRSRSVDIDIPATIEQLFQNVDRRIWDQLKPTLRKDGQFLSVCRSLDKHGVALVAKTLRTMANKGVFQLPKGR